MLARTRWPFPWPLMTYRLEFLPSALKEWRKLGATTQAQFKRKLAERLENPKIAGSKLRGSENRYKIKLRASGFRLVYAVKDDVLVVTVIAVGKRDGSTVYRKADNR